MQTLFQQPHRICTSIVSNHSPPQEGNDPPLTMLDPCAMATNGGSIYMMGMKAAAVPSRVLLITRLSLSEMIRDIRSWVVLIFSIRA